MLLIRMAHQSLPAYSPFFLLPRHTHVLRLYCRHQGSSTPRPLPLGDVPLPRGHSRGHPPHSVAENPHPATFTSPLPQARLSSKKRRTPRYSAARCWSSSPTAAPSGLRAICASVRSCAAFRSPITPTTPTRVSTTTTAGPLSSTANRSSRRRFFSTCVAPGSRLASRPPMLPMPPLPARRIRHERLGTYPSQSARSWLALIGRPRRYFRGLRPSSPGQPSARPKTLFLAKPNVASPERRFCTANRSPLRRCTSCCCRKCRRPSSRHRQPPDRKDQCRDLVRRVDGGGSASSGDGRTSQR